MKRESVIRSMIVVKEVNDMERMVRLRKLS